MPVPLPARSSFLLVLLAACATDTPAMPTAAPPLTEAAFEERAEAQVARGRQRGFPNLARLPGRSETLPTVDELNAERGSLEDKANELRRLRATAAQRPAPAALLAEARALRTAIARDRARLAANEPLAPRGTPPTRPRR